MARSESNWQIIFNAYLREKRLYGYYELKQTDERTFYFSHLKLNQYEGLQATEAQGLVWKLSDEDRRKKPCDTFCTPPLPSYVVIKFTDAFYFIRIADIVALREGGAVSISLDKAKELAERVVRVGI